MSELSDKVTRAGTVEEIEELIKDLTSDEKLDLMSEYGDWAEPSHTKNVAHYITMCKELPKLYMAVTDNRMSYNSYYPKRVIDIFNEAIGDEWSIYQTLREDLRELFSDNDIDGVVKYITDFVGEKSE